MNAVVIIPARYKSSRFPGKPLVDISGKSLIQRVWMQCVEAFSSDKVFIATDDERIVNHCRKNDMQYITTSNDCLTGTDRVAYAYRRLYKEYETIINVQGDEPLIEPGDILKVARAHNEFPFRPYCGMCKIKSKKEFKNPNTVKVVIDSNGWLLYASRAGIPTDKKLGFQSAYKQVCIYAFSPYDLSLFTGSGKTALESIEDIEFLRFLDRGHQVKMVEVSGSSIAVDVPEDIEKVKLALRRKI